MSELVNNLKKIVTIFKADSELIQKAAQRIEQLEASPKQQLRELGLSTDYEQRGLDIHNYQVEIQRLHDVIDNERKNTVAARKAEDEANEIIAKIAKAAECDNFADVIIARVEALAQQCNAMVRICEGHIANCRKAENMVARLNQNLSQVQNERDDKNSQLQARSTLLHDIADVLGAGSRNSVPARDWYMSKLAERHSHFREYLDVIGEAVGKPALSYKDLVEYFRGLNIEGLKMIADKANATEAERAKLAGKLADAERYVEARDISLNQLAQALGVAQSKDGWATTMLNRAEYLTHEVNSKGRKWDKAKTNALEECLTKVGYWPESNNVEGLKRLTNHVLSMRQERKEWEERLIEKNNYISQLERGFFPEKEELKLAHDSINRLEGSRVALLNDLTEAQKGATAARNELALAEGAIKRMHAKLIEYKEKTGIWPDDGKFRAKLDDIEWCLGVYIGRVVADRQLHEADTRFIADVRDSLSHEILRRNKQ